MGHPASTPEVFGRVFWTHVRADPSGCWEWAGCIDHRGYGELRRAGRGHRAHRVAWELVNGPIPPDLEVCHRCDNPPCVRPDHMFLGTHRENMRDAAAKGRMVVRPENRRRGEAHGMAKLTEAKVLEMRRLRSEGVSCRLLAVQFGVHLRTAYYVTDRRTWTHLGEQP